ncbi:MAG: PKD domain-containing protein [Caldilineaceae bacterium]
MFAQRPSHALLSALVIVSLLLSLTPPVVYAQTSGPVYLPLIANGETFAATDLVFRTHVTVNTSAQWQDLTRLGVVVLDKGEDWALVLVDDEQLETLARWRFTPEDTNTIEKMVYANTTLLSALRPLLTQAAQVKQQLAILSTASVSDNATLQSQVAALHTQLRSAMQSLDQQQRADLISAASVDSDGDGLTDDQEGYWCTNKNSIDSDQDGVNDGDEVKALKAWMNNKLAGPPNSGQPFNGWPPDNPGCLDNDHDSIPNLAERWELGLNMNLESTDRDRYDDGQELFGTTYCPGSGNACGYGQLPSANLDGVLLFPQMPSWVDAPGKHPLVAAFPKVEFDLVPDNTGHTFIVRAATTITTDQRHEEGETKSYNTTKTEGTSTANTEIETWSNWQETSQTSAALQMTAARLQTDPIFASAVNANQGTSNSTTNIIESTNIQTTDIVQNTVNNVFHLADAASKVNPIWEYGKQKLFAAADFTLNEACSEVNCKAYAGAAIRSAVRTAVSLPDIVQKNIQSNQCASDWLGKLKCAASAIGTKFTTTFKDRLDTALKEEQQAQGQTSGKVVADANNGFDVRQLYPMSFPAPPFVPTVTQTSGSSHGGSRGTTNTRYEEHSVTEGTAKQFGKSWGTATAQDSSHAADLWFAYELRNVGTDYARSICNLAINIYISDSFQPAATYFPGRDLGGTGCFINFQPGESHKYAFPSQSRIALTLDQLKAIDTGEPVRIVVEDLALGQDDYYADDAVKAGLSVAIEDGTDDGDATVDTYIIPTWDPNETVLAVLARYFPNETDPKTKTITAIWTPEFRSGAPPAWCKSSFRPTDYPDKILWCKHALSTADWWNIYTKGLGNNAEGFQSTLAVPGAVAFFRFNTDSDYDGYIDRVEHQVGTDAFDAKSFPRPEMLAGVHSVKSGNQVTSTLSLLNTGFSDAFGVEAVMIAPNDSISITNNTIGGSGRVRALKQVIVGSTLELPTSLPAPWPQTGHATPAVGGYYTGAIDRSYTFKVACNIAGGCTVGKDAWTLDWDDGAGSSGKLNFGSGYATPTFLPVGNLGITLALYYGAVVDKDSFTVDASTPRDTLQYTIKREPHTDPLVLVSYNDAQGSHHFIVPSQAMSLTTPTENLQRFAGQMLQSAGLELVTSKPFTPTQGSVNLFVNNPTDKPLVDTHLFLELIDISGTVASEIPSQITLSPGPTTVPFRFYTGDFNPPFNPNQDYIVMAFLTDYQGNILSTTGRPLSSFQADPLPKLTSDDTSLTWNFGSAPQGTLLKHPLVLANTGFGRLYTYIPPATGLALDASTNATVGAADQSSYQLTLRTSDLPVGPYNRTIMLATSDMANPTRTLHVQGTVTAPPTDTSGGVLQRPLDVPVTVTGTHSAGEWVDFSHNLGPDPQSLQPVKVYGQDYNTLFGVGKYATNFGQGTASADMFGDGRDSVMPSSGNLDNDHGFGVGIVNSGSAGSTSINVSDVNNVARINPGDVVLVHQTQGNNAGCWEMNKAVSDFAGGTATYQLAMPLKCSYVSDSGNNHAQILRVPQYSTCNVTGTVTPIAAWNGNWGGIFAVMCNGTMNVTGSINANAWGYRGGLGDIDSWAWTGEGEQSPSIRRGIADPPGNGGGATHVSCAGGGNGTAGVSGGEGTVGDLAGTSDLSSMVMGGGGGGAGDIVNSGSGGSGGGIVVIAAKAISISGAISSNGGAGQDASSDHRGGCGGAGGSIFIRSQVLDSSANTMNALAGMRGNGAPWRQNGDGGAGRIRVEYCNIFTGTTNPPTSTQKLSCYIVEQAEITPYTNARLNLPEAINGSHTYNVQFGRKLDFAQAGEQVTTLRIPAGLLASATLDILAQTATPGNLALKLDIGNDGSWDWDTNQTVATAATFASPNLSAAFNAFWQQHGAPLSGNLDIPVKLYLSQAATVLLTNLQQVNLTATGGTGAQLNPRPLDITVAVTGTHAQGEWINFSHSLGPDPQSLQPLRLYSQNYDTLYGKGKLIADPDKVYQTINATILQVDSSCRGDFGIYSPINQAIFTDYSSSKVGQSSTLRFLSNGQSAIYYIYGGSCYGGPHLSTGEHARVVQESSNVWRINWDDTLGDRDFNDVVVRISQTEDREITYVLEQLSVSSANLKLPTAINDSVAYNIQFGRMITFTAASNQSTNLRVPVGMMSSAKLDLLASGLAADANISLDIGDDGVVDWNGTFANNSTTTSPDLAAAFNAYWTSHGAPATGTLDAPVRVTNSGAGQLLLTNLQISSASSNLRYVRVSVQNYAKFLLDFTAGTSGAVVAALDVGDNGSIDWSSPAPGAAPMRWQTRDLSSALNAYLAGKSGDQLVPIRFYLSPSGAVTLNDYEASVATVTDLVASGITVGGAVAAANATTASIKQGDTINVTATLRNAGNVASGPVTVAFFANAAGWGDWYIGSQFFSSISASTPVTATVLWNTTGFSGTVPVKVVINPYKRVTESLYTNNSASTTANVLPPALPPVADFSAAPTSGNAPLTVQFTNTTTATLTALLWNFGDGATSNAQKPSHTYSNAGVYTVTLTVTGSSGSDTKVRSRYITVGTPPPPAPTANFSATPPSGNAPLAVQFTDLSTGNVTGWQWSFGDGATATTQHPAHTYIATGAYTVTLTVSGLGGSNTLRRSAFVNVAAGQVRVDIPLAPNWNLVALPVQPANPAVDQVLASINGKYNLVYAYKGCDAADPWKKYDPAAPPFANDLTTLDLTLGLWVRMTTTATLSVTGLVPMSTSIPLCNGWNLVGYPAQQARPVGEALTPLNGCYSMVYGYVAADLADVWKKYDPSAPPFANDLTALNPGRGYWIKANQACTWVVNR